MKEKTQDKIKEKKIPVKKVRKTAVRKVAVVEPEIFVEKKQKSKPKSISIFKKELSHTTVIYLMLGVVALGSLSALYYYAQQTVLKNNPILVLQKENQKLISLVGKLIELPIDEMPKIATILDTEKLREQPFFISAQNGDRVLAYDKAMKLILYRPSAHKIINATIIATSSAI